MDTQGFKNFHRQVRVLVALLLPLLIQLSLASPPIPAYSVKKTSDLRQAIFCPICVRASQQLVPHFLILALLLNPVHEDSELI